MNTTTSKFITTMVRQGLRQLVPNVGTVLVVALMLFVYNAKAATGPNNMTGSAVGSNPGVLSYQGTLSDASGNPLTATLDMTFSFFNVPAGGSALWVEVRSGVNKVSVKNGVFNVLLGGLTPIPSSALTSYPLYLEIKVGSDNPMTPRELIGSVPSAMSVPDGSIHTAQIADNSVTPQKAPFAAQHYIGPDGPVANSKVSTGTYIFPVTGGTISETVSIDITKLGYVGVPIGIAQAVDYATVPYVDMNTSLILARYDHSLSGSTNATAKITIFRSDGQVIPSGSVRIDLILWNN